MKCIQHTKNTLVLLITTLILTACSGGGDFSDTSTTLSGVFVDSNVKGLRYVTPSLSGVTDSNGSFKYREGESIEFFIGDLSLGKVIAKKLITPYTMAGDTDLSNPSQKAKNIALLLQNSDAYKQNTSLLDVSNMKDYKFTTINFNDDTNTAESKIRALLSSSDFQALINNNTSFIDSISAQENMKNYVQDLECSYTTITDDSAFSDSFPADIAWDGSAQSVEDIARVFNIARAHDTTISEVLVMPSQDVWDSMSIEKRALFLINNERYYRGIKPFEGISNTISSISQDYADLLYAQGVFEHNADASPWDRLDRDLTIKNNKDFFAYAENLYAHGGTRYTDNPMAKAIYNFIYNDNVATGGSYGHRKFCLATSLEDNSGDDGVEGLVGFAITKGDAYAVFPRYQSTIVVMNAFDPSSSWDHTNTIKTSFCAK